SRNAGQEPTRPAGYAVLAEGTTPRAPRSLVSSSLVLSVRTPDGDPSALPAGHVRAILALMTDGTTTGLRLGATYLPMLDRARIYCCGITPYDVTHLGHAATFVWVDVLTRVFAAFGVYPQLCRNVTDVDDVLFAAAERSGSAYDAFASVQQFRFDQDMSSLGGREPQLAPRARRNIEPVYRLSAELLESGTAYQRYRGACFPSA